MVEKFWQAICYESYCLLSHQQKKANYYEIGNFDRPPLLYENTFGFIGVTDLSTSYCI